jgi:hypothetical protein
MDVEFLFSRFYSLASEHFELTFVYSRAHEYGGSSYGTEGSAEGGQNNVTFKY